jgi:transcriptional regulator with XRE-family HTH domain
MNFGPMPRLRQRRNVSSGYRTYSAASAGVRVSGTSLLLSELFLGSSVHRRLRPVKRAAYLVDMTDNRRPRETASDTVARRVKELRKQRGWSARRLAEACAATGSPQLSESVIANIESGRREDGRRRRDVTVDETIAFAKALDVPAVHLLPVHLDPEATEVTLTFATAEKLWAFLNAAETVVRGLRQLQPLGWFKEDDDG